MNAVAVIFTLVSVLVYCQADESAAKKAIHDAAAKCALKLPGKEVMRMVGTDQLPTSVDEKCFLDCVYKNIGILADDKFFEAGAKKVLEVKYGQNPEKFKMGKSQIEACAKSVKSTTGKCSTAYNIRECFAIQGKKDNFFVA